MRRIALFVLLVALASAAACVGERERLDVPRISLTLDDTVATAGGTLTGRVGAADASGLTLLAVYACTRDSTYRNREVLFGQDSAAFAFSLRVAGVTPANAPVRVYAIALDGQNFSSDTSRVVYVRGGAPPSDSVDSGAGLCGVGGPLQ